MLKKITKLLVLFITMAVVLIFSPVKNARAATADQYCTPGGDWSTFAGHPTGLWQTFTPTQNRLTRIGLWLEGDGVGKVVLRITHAGSVLGTEIIDETAGYNLVYFDFDNLELVPGDSDYRIWPSRYTGNDTLYWHRSDDPNCYTSGVGYVDGIDVGLDWGFATYGFTQAEEGGDEPAGEPEGDTEPVADPGVDVTTNFGSAPSQNISADILPPTEFGAENTSKEDSVAVTLSWTKSTTEDIDGYKIFRKGPEEDAEFGQISQTEKSIISFIDYKVIENTDYTYMARAYKGNQESDNSNEAFLTASKKQTRSYNVLSMPLESLWDWLTEPIFLTFFGASTIAILGLLLWYLIARRKKKEAEADRPSAEIKK